MSTEREVSKSARKREALRLQQLGQALTRLNANQLSGLSLDDQLARAIADYHRFPSHEAKRRQLQFIGKLMRGVDTAAIEARLADLDGQSARARYHHRQLERWRDRLVADPAALQEYLTDHPETDRHQLQVRVARARKARDEAQRRAAARDLFRFLRTSQPDAGDCNRGI